MMHRLTREDLASMAAQLRIVATPKLSCACSLLPSRLVRVRSRL